MSLSFVSVKSRCPEHGIALAREGTCVVCRREAIDAANALVWRRRGERAASISGAVVVLIALAFIVRREMAHSLSAEPVRPAASVSAPAAESVAVTAGASSGEPPVPSGWVSEPIAPDLGEEDRETLRQLQTLLQDAQKLLDQATGKGTPPPPVVLTPPPAPQPPPPEYAALAAERAREQAARQAQKAYEAWAHREVMANIEEEEARARRINTETTRQVAEPAAASNVVRGTSERSESSSSGELRSGVPITMYSTSWCGVCKAARSYLQGQQIAFTERDVETDVYAASEARRLNPGGSVPTFDVGGIPLIGFTPSSLKSAILQAAKR